jgi:predicted short-subunit dehydrogenase-like oxidoreductase (DUF2520 family)
MTITIIGSGNVATHMAATFKNAGHSLLQIYSRDMHKAALLAYHVNAAPIDNLDDIDTNTHIFVIAVKDDAIAGVAKSLAKYQKLIVHTSGATDLQELSNFTTNAGVLYPLQTFNKGIELDFSSVPLCIEGADESITTRLEELALTISKNVSRVSSNQRKVLHLAAVFACNFPNYLYYAAGLLLNQNGMDFGLLRPLILETAKKVQDNPPVEVQTGPAIRNDDLTMASHLEILKDDHGLKVLYEMISQEIIKNLGTGHPAK